MDSVTEALIERGTEALIGEDCSRIEHSVRRGLGFHKISCTISMCVRLTKNMGTKIHHRRLHGFKSSAIEHQPWLRDQFICYTGVNTSVHG